MSNWSHHVWDEDECLRCGIIDRTYNTQPTESEHD